MIFTRRLAYSPADRFVGRVIFRFALLLSLSFSTLYASPPAGYYQVWSDEFNGSSLNTTFWNYRQLGARRDAFNMTNAVSFNSSNLVITTYSLNGTNYTGMLATDSKFLLKYGYLESSINFDDSPGMWSAFWLQSPTMGSYIGDPAYAGDEIDVCEHRHVDGSGNNIDGIVQVNLHWDGYGTNAKSTGSGNVGSGLGSGFHTYGFKWTDTNYAFSIDGSQKWSSTSAVSDRSEYILLSSEVQNASWAGNIPTGGYGDLNTSTTKCYVDFVRYYAPTTTVFWDGSSSSAWTNPANWVGNQAAKTNDDIVFSYLSTANPATTLAQDYSLRSLSVLETPAPISVTGAVLTVGAGGIDLVSAKYDVSLNSPVVLGATQSWGVGASRTLNLNATVSGPGTLTTYGYGTVRLAASNSFTGDTRIRGGTLSLLHTNALQLSTVDMSTNDSGTLALNNLNAVLGGLEGERSLPLGSGTVSIGNNGQSTAYGGTLTGSACLVKTGSGTLSLTDSNFYTGGTLISQGVLQLGSNTPTGTLVGTITNNASLSVFRSDALTLINPVIGSGSLSVRTTNGLSLDASAAVNVGGVISVGRDYYGKLIIKPGAQVTAGTLYVGNPASIAGDVLQLGGNVTFTNQFRLGHWPTETSSYLLGGGTLTLTAKPSGVVNPSGAVEQPGILYLGIDGTGIFTQTNGIASADGIVLDARTETPGTDSFTLNGGTFCLGASGIKSGSLDANTSFQINLGGGTLAARADWSSSRPITLTGTNGGLTLDTGTNTVSLSGQLTGPGGLLVQGAGTLLLSGSNSFSGDIIINSGCLSLLGICGGYNGIIVSPGAALKGTGINLGRVVVNGTLAPGAGVGTLTTGQQTWNPGGILAWKINNPTNSAGWDQLSISGTLDLGATPGAPFIFRLISLTAGGLPGLLQGFNNQSNYTWTVAQCGGLANFDPAAFVLDASGFANPLAGGAFTLERSVNAVVLKFHPNANPPSFASAHLNPAGTLQLAATGVPGKLYNLESATNLAPPLIWSFVTNATADPAGSIQFFPLPATNAPQVFYRLNGP